MRIKNIEELNNSNINSRIAKLIKNKLLSGNTKEKENKYKNIKTARFVNKKEVMFDSEKEAKHYDELFLKVKAGIITELKLQPKFEIIPTVIYQNKALRKIIYKADFSYVANGITFVIDVKGFKTEVYKIKKRLFLLNNPDVVFLEI